MNQKTINLANTQSVYLETYFDDLLLCNATGFFAKLKTSQLGVITNWHVLSGKNQVTKKVLHSKNAIPNKLKVFYHRRGLTGVWHSIDIPLLKEDYQPLWKEHSHYNNSVDVAGIQFPDIENAYTPSYDPSYKDNNYLLGVSEPVSIVGFPFGQMAAQKIYGFDVKTPIWTAGNVATEPDLDITNLPLYYVDCRARKGQSGSPVISTRDSFPTQSVFNGKPSVTGQLFNLHGVYSGRISAKSDIGRVWKNSVIVDILKQI